jgi:radical SAM family uncharacterized protein/radical SAM-linked protein
MAIHRNFLNVILRLQEDGNIPMDEKKIQDILSAVEKPSRYLGSEINSIRKDPERVRLRIALAFPDLYEIGTSHFGLQILYQILNSHPDIGAERVYAPAADMDASLRASATPLFSLESHTPLDRFDILGFSLLYELNYTNVLNMLELAGIALRASERGTAHPFVIAGGPCTCNPEPVASFFDAMVVGDGEAVVLEMAETALDWKAGAADDRTALLRRWAGIEGVYVPSLFEVRYDGAGFPAEISSPAGAGTVRRAVLADLDPAPFPARPVLPYGKPVHDRLRLELARGCSRGCRFCQAGMIYRPVRERSPQRLLSLAAQALGATGYEDISLLSLSTGDYRCLTPLLEQLMARYEGERVAVSLPSLRAGTLSPELMALVKKVRRTGFTIAPEAGSQRLRDVINKSISEKEIFDTVRDAFQMGWRLIKLYFMIGLPTETEDDLREMVALVRSLRKIKPGPGGRGQLNVSLATFIPKAHTPFQWSPQLPLAQARDRLRWVQDRLQLAGVHFKWQNPEMSLLEGVFARGDRRLDRVLEAAYRRGCRFDGWSDQLRIGSWMSAFDEAGLDPEFYTVRPRALEEPLPWDHIDTRVSKEFLISEWRCALSGLKTEDCRDGDCRGCGVCDFERIAPRVHCDMPAEGREEVRPEPDAGFKRIQLSYAKTGNARFFGHLELVNIFLRAMRRAGIPLKYSEGFHPKPRVSFDNPLPVGMESEEERMILTVAKGAVPQTVMDGLNARLPEGLRIHACAKDIAPPPKRSTYRILFDRPLSEPQRFSGVRVDLAQMLELQSAKGKLKKIALKDILFDIGLPDASSLELTLSCEPGNTVRPAEILKQVFGMAEEEVQRAVVRKLKTAGGGGP